MIKKLIATTMLVATVGCATTPHTGVFSSVSTLFGLQITTPQIGNIPAFKGQIGLMREEILTMKGSNTFSSFTTASDSGILRPVTVTRTINASSSDATTPSK